MSSMLKTVLVTSLCAGSLFAVEQEVPSCTGPQSMRVAARYTTPKGIGYHTGYTTLETFLAKREPIWGNTIPFLDLRGHVFDNGKLAANAGMGLRFLTSSRVWGVNTYYDYRNTSREHYNQVALGIESLGTVWDYRINGYLPVGKKHSALYHAKFYDFQDHYMLLKSSRDSAMKGFNAEAGLHIDCFKKAPLYFAAGPYYLTGKGASTWGGELRGAVDLCYHYLRLEANVAYDHFFKWTGQGQVSVNVSFGAKRKFQAKRARDCLLYARALQRVDRNEIIPVGKMKVVAPAINPQTGDPYIFWFVDNTSSSLGTFESPFPSLAQALGASSPNDGIYVFPGNGSLYGLNESLTLQNNQLLLGASTPHPIQTTLGTISIPPYSSTQPTIGNSITLGNDNTVSGFIISGSLTGTNIVNLNVTQSIIAGAAIDLSSASGQLVIENSSFLGGITLDAASALDSLSISGSSFSQAAIVIGGSIDQFEISDTLFSERGSNPVIQLTGSVNTWNISGSSFNGINSATNGIEIDSGASVGSLNISDSSFSLFSSTGVSLMGGSTVGSLNISGSSFDINPNAIQGEGSISTLAISRCNFNANTNSIDLSGATCDTVTISQTTFNATGDGLYTDSGTTIGTLNVSNSNFTNTTGEGILLTGSLNNVDIAGCNFAGNGNEEIILSNPTIAVLNITDCRFSNTLSGGGGVGGTGSFTTFNLSDNYFSGCGSGSIAITFAAASTTSATFENNTFYLNGFGTGVMYENVITLQNDCDLTFSGNQFTSLANALSIQIPSGSSNACVRFVDNTATPLFPSGTFYAGTSVYNLKNLGTGTFQLTSDSTQLNNSGLITETNISTTPCDF